MVKRIVNCVVCGREREHTAKGMCDSCYSMNGPKRMATCKSCKKIKAHYAKGLCRTCYAREGRPKITCANCGKETINHAKGLCASCYLNTKFIICKSCGKKKRAGAKGMCGACYTRKGAPEIICKKCGVTTRAKGHGLCRKCYEQTTEATKKYNMQIDHHIPFELYKEITKACFICGFDKIVHLHHIDSNHSNTSKTNFVGLCPNHHSLIHMNKFRKSIIAEITKIRERDLNSKKEKTDNLILVDMGDVVGGV